MLLFASFEKKLKLKKMSNLGFSNYFIINKLKQNGVKVVLKKNCVR
jgi:predicted acetyltransferase